MDDERALAEATAAGSAPTDPDEVLSEELNAQRLAGRLGLGAEADSSLDLERHESNHILELGEKEIEDLVGHLPGLFKTARSALSG